MRQLPGNSFNDLTLLVEDINTNDNIIGVFPGAFKPPHKGHFATAAAACSECAEVHIIMSSKERLLRQVSKDLGKPESAKYQGLMRGGNTNNNIKAKVNVELGEVDRLTSASDMRASICDTAYGTDDMTTFERCMDDFLPKQLTSDRRQTVINMLFKARQDDTISSKEASGIWGVYIDQLRDLYKNTDIYFTMSEISPIADTYAFALNLYDKTQHQVTLKLYTGQ